MADEYSRSLAKVAVAQVAEVAGFDACMDSAVEILADLLLRYTSTICTSAHDYAELAGRTRVNVPDVLLSLEDLGLTSDDLNQYTKLQVGVVAIFDTLSRVLSHRCHPSSGQYTAHPSISHRQCVSPSVC